MLLALLLVTSFSLITIDYRGGESSPLDGVRSRGGGGLRPGRAGCRGDREPGQRRGRQRRQPRRRPGRGRAAGQGRTSELRPRLRTSELDRQPRAASSTPAAPGRGRALPDRARAGDRDRRGPDVLLDRHHRRRQPGRHPAGHDRAQRRRPGRPGQDRRPGDRRRCCSPSTPSRRSGVRLEGSMEVGFTTGQGVGDRGTLRPASCSTARRRVARGRPAGHLRLAGRHAVRARGPGRQGRVGAAARPGSQTRSAVVRRTSTSPRSTSSASSSSRRAPTRATPCCRRGRRRTPTPTVTVTVTAEADDRRRWLTCRPAGSCSRSSSLVVALVVQVTLLARLPLPGATPDLRAARRRRAGAGLRARLRPGLRLRGRAGQRPRAAGRPRGRPLGAGADAWSATSPGWLADETRRSAFVPLVVVAVAGAGVGLLYAGLGALIDDPHVTWRRGAARCCRPRFSTTWC